VQGHRRTVRRREDHQTRGRQAGTSDSHFPVYCTLTSVQSESVHLTLNRGVLQESEGVPLATIREAHLLKELHHPNILHLRTVYVNSAAEDLTLSLVFEFVDHDLHEMMQV
jgi:serine/threonine protein kinase